MADGAGFTITDSPDDEKRGPAQREKIISAVFDAGAILWRTLDGDSCCTIPNAGRLERYRIKSTDFRRMAAYLYGAANPVGRGDAPSRPGAASDQAMREALNGLDAQAFMAEARQTDVRLLETPDGIMLDLGNPAWSVVRITAAGWQVEPSADIGLMRASGMMPLPMPRKPRKVALADLRRLLNVATDTDFRLAVAWLLTALYPSGPYPVLAVDGEQGSGKSTTCKMLRRLVDPNTADLRRPPRDERDVLVSAKSSRVVAFDNMSTMTGEMADILCRLATGAGLGERRLYTNDEEYITSVMRPVLLNGIPSLLARGDLADRSIAITLPPIPDANRKPEADVWADFDAAAPDILGLLLDGLVTALRRLPALKLTRLPRMADFARLACAAAPAFGWTADDMLDALEVNRAASVAGVIEADPVAEAVQRFIDEKKRWEGTASDLLMQLGMEVAEDTKRERSWPRRPIQLSMALKRAAPALRRIGITIETARSAGTGQRRISIEQREIGKSASQSSHPAGKIEEIRHLPDRDDRDDRDVQITPMDVEQTEPPTWVDDPAIPAW